MRKVVLPLPSEQTTTTSDASQGSGAGAASQTSPHPVPSSSASAAPASNPHQRQTLPYDFRSEILNPALKVGAAAGACGALTGGAAGIIRSAPTVLFSAFSAVQWFTLGTSYYGARLAGLKYFPQGEQATPQDKLKASTVAGGFAGTLGGMLRGPRNIIPGALVFSLLGAGGQGYLNRREARPPAPEKKPESSGSSWWSRWSPIKRLSDEDYAAILEERVLQLEADIALIDERIEEIRKSEQQAKKDAAQAGNSNAKSPSSSKA